MHPNTSYQSPQNLLHNTKYQAANEMSLSIKYKSKMPRRSTKWMSAFSCRERQLSKPIPFKMDG
jgi:hypothetical protein